MKTGRYYYKPHLIGDGSPSRSPGTLAPVMPFCGALLGTEAWAALLPTGSAALLSPITRLCFRMGLQRHERTILSISCLFSFREWESISFSRQIQEASFALFVKFHMVVFVHKEFFNFRMQRYLFFIHSTKKKNPQNY